MSTDPTFTLRQIAEIEQVDEKTVRTWVKQGWLRAHDASRNRGRKRKWRVTLRDLEAFRSATSNTIGEVPKPERRRKAARPQGFVEYV